MKYALPWKRSKWLNNGFVRELRGDLEYLELNGSLVYYEEIEYGLWCFHLTDAQVGTTKKERDARLIVDQHLRWRGFILINESKLVNML